MTKSRDANRRLEGGDTNVLVPLAAVAEMCDRSTTMCETRI